MNNDPTPPPSRQLVPTEIPAFNSDATEEIQEGRPMLGEALMKAIEEGDILLHYGATCQWVPNAARLLEDRFCPLLANALVQPLQHDWVLLYFVACQLVHADKAPGNPVHPMRMLLATYIQMACGELPWPNPDRELEAKFKERQAQRVAEAAAEEEDEV